jgi:flagellar hook-associated protein 2
VPIQFSGLGSGLDVDGIVSQLMTLERRPLEQLDKTESGYKAQLSAYGSMKAALASLQSAAAAVATAAKFRAAKATVGDTALLSASATSASAAGSYAIEVEQLAQAQKLKSAVVPALGTGSLTIEFGSYSGGGFTLNPDKASKTLTVNGSSLAAARDAINAAGAGVRANIVNDGSGERLVIASEDTGLKSALRITVDDADGNDTDATGLSALAYDASIGGTANLSETVAALDARVVIDGMTVTGASNNISGAIEGVTLSLKKAAPGTETTLAVGRDTDSAKLAVDAFVKAYNDAAKSLKTLSAYDAATRTGAVLQGDATLVSIQARLRSALSTTVSFAGGYNSLSDIGIAFQRDGTITADAVKLRAALENTGKDAASALAALGVPTDSDISYFSATPAAEAGSYPITVTQLATRGFAAGSAPAALTITAGVNDTLQLTVDGAARTVTLTAGTYSAATLTAMVQSRIDGVEATEAGGVLTLTSKTWGAASGVAITGGNAAPDLFGVAASTAGVNVQGTIGGVAATGAGRNLTAKGLTVTVNGGALGARGSLGFSRGIADRISQLIDGALEDSIGARTDGIAASLRGLEARRTAVASRMEAVEKRYRAQFIALDNMMSSMNSTSSFLSQQLANLPKSGA